MISRLRPGRLFSFFFLFAPALALAQAPPEISLTEERSILVRAETNLRLRSRKSLSGTVAVVELRDNLFTPLDGYRVTLSIAGKTFRATTIGGVAEFDLSSLPYAEYEAVAYFEGTPEYAPSSALLRLDIAKDTPSLELESPVEIALDEPDSVLIATLSIGGQPIPGAPLQLEGLRGEPRRGLTDEAGQVSFALSPKDLLKDGQNPLTVRFPGDDRRNPVEVQRAVVLVVPVFVTLSGPAVVASDEEISLTGTLKTPLGPLAGKSVSLFGQIARGQERSFGSARTGADGSFTIRLAARLFRAPGELTLVSKYQPDTPWHRPAESEPLSLRLRPPRPVPAAFYLVPLFICAAIALGMLILRRLRRRAIQPKVVHRPTGGVFTNTASTLGPEEFGFSGIVQDAQSQKPIFEARLRLTGEKEQREITTDQAGSFSFEKLPPGRYQVRAEAYGFVSEEFRVEIPHRGRWRGVRVALVPVREKVLEIFREIAIRVLPESSLWGRWTPRELRRFVRERRHAVQGPLGELVMLFEKVYFAGIIGDESTVARAKELAQESRKILDPPAHVPGAHIVAEPPPRPEVGAPQ